MSEIQAELETIRKQDADGVLRPEAVVKYARMHKTSALHARFEWDVKKAAYENWLLTARQLIRVHFTVLDTGNGDETTRVYYSPAPTDDGRQRGYIRTADALADPEMRQQIISAQIERLWNIYKSYALPELKPIGNAIERCRRTVPMLEAAE